MVHHDDIGRKLWYDHLDWTQSPVLMRIEDITANMQQWFKKNKGKFNAKFQEPAAMNKGGDALSL